jgi:hypothetical protein
MSTSSIFVVETNSDRVEHRQTLRRRSIIHEFGLTTSAHGIPGIARSKSIHNRLFWSISFVAFVSITIYFVVREIRSYFDYSTQTSINIVSEWPQHFPAFTVCNLAPVRYDRFIEPFMNYTKALNLTNMTEFSTFTSAHIRHMGDFFQTSINRNQSLEPFFFPLQSMLMKCVFNGYPCSAANFTSFALPTYGLCHTFNAKLKKSNNVRYSDAHGGTGILSLRFYVHSHQYVPYIREGEPIESRSHSS